MKKMKKRSKGFTLTELAIVIAVIAILVAVLVPTFTSLIKKAEESSDKQLVKNLNTILTTDESISGNVESMSDAVAVAESNGYNVANLSPTSSGYDILWDQVNNRFFLVNEDNQVVYADSATGLSEGDNVTAAYTYWRIIESESDYEKYSAEGYSLYITTDLDVETVTSNGGVEYAEGVTSKATTVTATTGSATTNTSSTEGKALASTAIKTASNTNLPLVIVKTNGGSLTVEVTGDATVKHNGTADSVALNGSTTYFRNASIKYDVEINSADVTYIPPEDEELKAETVSIVITSSVTTTTDAQKIITMLETTCADSNITIGATTNILASVTTTTTTIEIVTSIISTDFAGGLGTESSPYQIASTDDWLSFKEYLEGTKETAGKWNSTYNYIDGGFYYEVTADLDFSNVTDSYYIENFAGYLDFGGHTLSGLDNNCLCNTNEEISGFLFNFVWGNNATYSGVESATTIANLTIEHNNTALINYVYMFAASSSGIGDVILSNITTTGNLTVDDNNTTPFVLYSTSTSNGINTFATLHFEKCVNETKVVSTADSSAALFIGACYSKVSFTDCSNKGTLIHTTGYASMLIGNAYYLYKNLNSYDGDLSKKVSVSNCVNYGTILAPDSNTSYTTNLLCGAGGSDTSGQSYSVDVATAFITAKAKELYSDSANGAVCQKTTIPSLTSSGNIFDLSTISADSYTYTVTIRLQMYKKATDESPTVWGSYGITFTLKSTDTLYSYEWKSYWDLTDEQKTAYESATTVTMGNKTVKILTISGTTYFILDKNLISWNTTDYEKVTINDGVTVTGTLFAYNNSGASSGYYTYSYPKKAS